MLGTAHKLTEWGMVPFKAKTNNSSKEKGGSPARKPSSHQSPRVEVSFNPWKSQPSSMLFSFLLVKVKAELPWKPFIENERDAPRTLNYCVEQIVQLALDCNDREK